jgi:transmembrane sensor
MENNIDKLFKEKVDQITSLPENIEWNVDTGWMQYQKKFLTRKTKVKKILISLLSVAAVLVIVFTVVFHPNLKNRTIVVKNNAIEVRQITLPDGNMVWLNKNSTIEYPSGLNSESFGITVSGEVYIDINQMRSERYILKAYNAIIMAEKASSFNIKALADKENIDIAVASGAIKVQEEESPTGLTLLVTDGNYCSVHKSQKLIYASVNTNDNYLAWKTGRLVFEDQSMATVTDILSEYYNTPIELSDNSLAYCMFSGSFDKPTIDIILNKIKTDLNLEIKYTGAKISISGKGCL